MSAAEVQEFVTAQWLAWRKAIAPMVPSIESQLEFCRHIRVLRDIDSPLLEARS